MQLKKTGVRQLMNANRFVILKPNVKDSLMMGNNAIPSPPLVMLKAPRRNHYGSALLKRIDIQHKILSKNLKVKVIKDAVPSVHTTD